MLATVSCWTLGVDSVSATTTGTINSAAVTVVTASPLTKFSFKLFIVKYPKKKTRWLSALLERLENMLARTRLRRAGKRGD